MDWLKEFCIGLSFIVKLIEPRYLTSDMWCEDICCTWSMVVQIAGEHRLAIELVREGCCSHLHPSRRVDLIGGMSRWLLSQRYREGWSQLCSMSRQCHEMHWPCSDYGSSPEVHEILPTTQVPQSKPSSQQCHSIKLAVPNIDHQSYSTVLVATHRDPHLSTL